MCASLRGHYFIGGPGWDAVRRHVFEEEMALAHAPRVVPFGLAMLAPRRSTCSTMSCAQPMITVAMAFASSVLAIRLTV